jgi:prolyl-tRNA synthetase
MVHSDNRGLVLPPRVAPTQVIIVPVMQKKAGVLDRAYELRQELLDLGLRVDIDDSPNYSPGWKFNEYEMKGVPIRIEIGPRDIKNGIAMVARRDTLEKDKFELLGIGEKIKELLETIHEDMYNKALKMRERKHML